MGFNLLEEGRGDGLTVYANLVKMNFDVVFNRQVSVFFCLC
jgi:hypothetical protein